MCILGRQRFSSSFNSWVIVLYVVLLCRESITDQYISPGIEPEHMSYCGPQSALW